LRRFLRFWRGAAFVNVKQTSRATCRPLIFFNSAEISASRAFTCRSVAGHRVIAAAMIAALSRPACESAAELNA
jgi:hypothetical protein